MERENDMEWVGCSGLSGQMVGESPEVRPCGFDYYFLSDYLPAWRSGILAKEAAGI